MFKNRQALFVSALVAVALLSGLMADWMGPGPQGVTGTPVVLASLAFIASFVVGISWQRRRSLGRATDPVTSVEPEDIRPVLLLIWWPIVLVAALGPLFVLWVIAAFTMSGGLGFPLGLCLGIGVLGLTFTPLVIDETIWAFRGRGFRGFWRASSETPWGDGIDAS